MLKNEKGNISNARDDHSPPLRTTDGQQRRVQCRERRQLSEIGGGERERERVEKKRGETGERVEKRGRKPERGGGRKESAWREGGREGK